MNEVACHPTPDQLTAFDRGLLSSPDWEGVAQHVAQCLSCCQRLETVPDDATTSLLKASSGSTCAIADDPVPVPALPEPPPGLAGHPRYRVLGFLGAGGMGVVFKAEHRLMERPVALKVLHRNLTSRPSAVERFRQEVKAAARLNHPNIVTAYDADEADGAHFLVMEFVEGKSLDRLLEGGEPLPVAQACDLIHQAALGLHYAFTQGMVHRDLKPANLMVTTEGRVKILDFGLALFAVEPRPNLAHTPAGTILGTPDYIAPEQAHEGCSVDIRADIYSLGCTLYHLLTGQPPFPNGSPLQKLLAHQDTLPRPVTQVRGDLPAALAALLDRMLAKDPARRPQTPGAVARALEPFARGEPVPPVRRHRRWLLAAGLAACVLLVLALGIAKVRQLVPVSPGPQLPPPGPEEGAGGPRRGAWQQLDAWLRHEAAPKVEAELRADILRQHDRVVGPGTFFFVQLGPGLVRSGKATFLAGRDDDFFVLHPGPSVPVAPATAVIQTAAPQDHELPINRPVVLSSLSIEKDAQLDGRRPVRGKVAFASKERIQGELALRLTAITGVTLTLYSRLDQKSLSGKGVLLFEFPALTGAGGSPAGMAVVLLDLCVLGPAGRAPKALVVSNGVAAIVP